MGDKSTKGLTKPIESMLRTSPISEAVNKLSAAEFLNTTLAYLPYEAIEEPLLVIFRINRTVPVGYLDPFFLHHHHPLTHSHTWSLLLFIEHSLSVTLDAIKKALAYFGAVDSSRVVLPSPSSSTLKMQPPVGGT